MKVARWASRASTTMAGIATVRRPASLLGSSVHASTAARSHTRPEANSARSLRPPRVGPFEAPLTADERRAVAELIEDGTLAAAIAAVAADDPDLADQ
ncbi:MAG TPA: hypothetical protein VM142_09160 [Acidimicrobiales bacterium]|nr:hypothetical protein [Acidimicrobiales bacterium]